jgi:hypothetical protein
MKFAGFLLKGNCLSSVSYFVRSSFPWNSIWKVKAPLKMAFFVWTTALSMCKKCGKSIDHLLLHCEVARELWAACFSSCLVLHGLYLER